MGIANKKRLAVLNCGHSRTFEKCYDNFLSKVIAPNAEEYDIDVFVVTSSIVSQKTNTKPIFKPKLVADGDRKYNKKTNGIIYEVDEERLRRSVEHIYSSSEYRLVGVFFVPENIKDNNIDPLSWEWFRRGIFSKPYYAMTKMKEEEEKIGARYDAVLRTRPDVILGKDIRIKNLERDTLYLPGGWVKNPQHYEDRFYIVDFLAHGDRKSMEKYADIHKMREPLQTKVKSRPECSENQLYIYLKKNNIKIKFSLKDRSDYKIQRK
jgi:hypothetical protein